MLDGYNVQCKECHAKCSRKYYLKDKVRINERNRLHYVENRDRVLTNQQNYYSKNKDNKKKYACKNRERTNRTIKLRLQNNVNERMGRVISSHIRMSLKGNKKGQHWEYLVGYTLQELIKHLEIYLQMA